MRSRQRAPSVPLIVLFWSVLLLLLPRLQKPPATTASDASALDGDTSDAAASRKTTSNIRFWSVCNEMFFVT